MGGSHRQSTGGQLITRPSRFSISELWPEPNSGQEFWKAFSGNYRSLPRLALGDSHPRIPLRRAFSYAAAVAQFHDLGRLAVAGCGDDISGAFFRFNGPCRLSEVTTVVVIGPSIASGGFLAACVTHSVTPASFPTKTGQRTSSNPLIYLVGAAGLEPATR